MAKQINDAPIKIGPEPTLSSWADPTPKLPI
jgi:hypothetical protein